jgi:hypothetical protein
MKAVTRRRYKLMENIHAHNILSFNNRRNLANVILSMEKQLIRF